MIALSSLLVLAAGAFSSDVPVRAPTTGSLVAFLAPQDAPRKPVAPPGGGTPEPTMLLLLAGGALGYGALRLSRRNKDGSGDA